MACQRLHGKLRGSLAAIPRDWLVPPHNYTRRSSIPIRCLLYLYPGYQTWKLLWSWFVYWSIPTAREMRGAPCAEHYSPEDRAKIQISAFCGRGEGHWTKDWFSALICRRIIASYVHFGELEKLENIVLQIAETHRWTEMLVAEVYAISVRWIVILPRCDQSDWSQT